VDGNKLISEQVFDLDLEFDDLSALDESTFDIGIDAANTAVLGVNATMAGLQTTALQDAINNYARALNESAIAKTTGLPVRTSSVQYKGFAAEEYFKQTLKINALAKGVPDWQLGAYTKGALPDGTTLSGIDMETDITVFKRKNLWKPAKSHIFIESVFICPAVSGCIFCKRERIYADLIPSAAKFCENIRRQKSLIASRYIYISISDMKQLIQYFLKVF